jgi:hypothetical protein
MPIDYSKYPPNWKSEIVPAVLKRASYCCEMCGAANTEHLFSVFLNLKECGGRYKKRRIWVSGHHDVVRLASIGIPVQEKRIKVQLTVAHLDHDESNHDVSLDRLMAMCQWCHLNYDAKEKYRRACNKV